MFKLFFKIILLHTVVFSHQFFLTTTEVRLSDNQKNLEVTIQTFSHDVEALLKAADFNLANLGSIFPIILLFKIIIGSILVKKLTEILPYFF